MRSQRAATTDREVTMYPYNDNHRECSGGCGELADECACRRPNPLGSMTMTVTHDRPVEYKVEHGNFSYLDPFYRGWVQNLARQALGSATPTTALYRKPGGQGSFLRIADATPAQLAAVEAAFAADHVPFTLTAVTS